MSLGLITSVAERWLLFPQALEAIPYKDFFTGRIPDIKNRPFPYMSLVPGPSYRTYRSDKWVGSRRIVSFHIWVDEDQLNRGEEIAEVVQFVYANRAWGYGYGRVIDVLDNGPPNSHQIHEASFKSWEVVQMLTLCIEQPRAADEGPCIPSGKRGSGSGAASTGSIIVPPLSSGSNSSSRALSTE